LSETTFETAYEGMRSYLGHNGRPLNVIPYALLTGPSNRGVASDICQNDFRALLSATAATYVQGQNRNKGLVTPYVSSRLVGADAGKWFLLGEKGGICGPIYQERVRAEFQQSRLSDDSDFVFANDKYQYGARARGRAFLSLPHLIFGNYA